MTVCAANARLLSLKMQLSNVEYEMLAITSVRQKISYQTVMLADEDFESPVMDRLHSIDQIYELKQSQLETLQKQMSTELDSVQKLLDNNIKKEFKLNIS